MNPRPSQVGIIDVGSNTIKLLIAEKRNGDEVHLARFEVEETRIGEGMTPESPNLSQSALDDGVAAIERLLKIANEQKVESLRIVATSAVRDAHNKESFRSMVFQRTGLPIEILSGHEEARLISKGIQCDSRYTAHKDYTLLDLGGGSLECIQFSDGQVTAAHSLDLGAVRLTSYYVVDRHSPLDSNAVSSIQEHVRRSLRASGIPASHPNGSSIAILTGGTGAAIASIESLKIGSSGLHIKDAVLLRERVCSLPSAERILQLEIPKPRADIFPAATTILCEALEYFACDRLYFSNCNLRFGIAAEMLEVVGPRDTGV